MKRSLLRATIPLTLLASLAVAGIDVEITNGARVRGTADADGSIERFRARIPRGAQVRIDLRARRSKERKRKVPLTAVLVAPDETPIAATVEPGRRARLKVAATESTGIYELRISTPDGEAGDYDVRVSWRGTKRVRQRVDLAGDAAVEIVADAGSRLSGKLAGPAGTQILRVENEDGEPVLTPEPGTSRLDAVELTETGTYRVIAAPGDGRARASLRVMPPDRSRALVRLLEEDLAPDLPTDLQLTEVAVGAVVSSDVTTSIVVADTDTETDGARLDVPAGALTTTTTLVVASSPQIRPDVGTPLDDGGPAVFFGPAGTEFETPVTVSVPFDESIEDPSELLVVERQADGTQRVVDPATYVFGDGVISLPVSHFTSFQAFRPGLVQSVTALPVPAFDEREALSGSPSRTAISGEWAAFGVLGLGGEAGGRIFVHRLVDGVWQPTQTIERPVAVASNDQFTFGVGLDGDVLVGAGGGAFAFRRSGDTFEFEQELALPGGVLAQGGAGSFPGGQEAAVSGDTIVVQAGTGAFETFTEAVAVFRYDGDSWELEQVLTPDDSVANEFIGFGWSVAIDGDTIVATAPKRATPAAYVFTRSGTTWTQQQRIVPSDTGPGPFDAELGETSEGLGAYGVGLDGDRIAIGRRGVAGYVFERSGVIWTETARITAADVETSLPPIAFPGGCAIENDVAAFGTNGFVRGAGYFAVFTRDDAGDWERRSLARVPDEFDRDFALRRSNLVRDFGRHADLDGGRLTAGLLTVDGNERIGNRRFLIFDLAE